MRTINSIFISIFLIVASVLIAGTDVTAQAPGTRKPGRDQISATYTVELKNSFFKLFHVTATFGNLRQPTLDVALPVWTPGVYDAKNYATNIRKFTVHDPSGAKLRAPKFQASAWRIETSGSKTVIVEFDYVATDLSWNGAGVSERYAFFTGTQLFLEPIGHRNISSTVRFIMPTGWTIASALRDTPDPAVFTAADYDELVDSPTALGSVDVTRFEAEGKPHFLVRAPADAKCTDDLSKLTKDLQKIIGVERTIFGSLPYDKYVFFCIDTLSGGALEHANSTVSGYLWASGTSAAHETFHAWNVKRIRPEEMWPYDYSRVNPGPSLWVSEGITSYYQALISYRANLDRFALSPGEGTSADQSRLGPGGETELLKEFAYQIAQFESMPERRFMSPSDASISDGMGYGAAGPNYYTSGELLGVLLDLSIIRDTHGKKRLDDVMRSLYSQNYLKGKGFSPADLARTVSATAGRDYTEFFQRYVTRTDDFPLEDVLAYAGYQITRSTQDRGALGIQRLNDAPEGYRVRTPGGPRSPSVLAGIQVGDVIVAVDGVPIHQVPIFGLYGPNWIGARFVEKKAGERVVLTVARDSTRREVALTLNSFKESVVRIERDPAATPQALAIRNEWLRR